ncbi:hypothetical protein [Schumannella soli]|uniref:Uncharacterized protein n=1 Tax=Schumannella soli TaxID=2590779 RepID=A0A506Y9K9_9MICO|nr:hypothetical protein [Schumannella soli]TPW77787.1 hypothetical protein FJ657_03825 [Schumannella soli]
MSAEPDCDRGENTMFRIRKKQHAIAGLVIVGVAVVGLAGCSAPAVKVPANVRAAVEDLSNLPPDLSIAHSIQTSECLQALGWDVGFDTTALSTTRNTLIGVVGVFPSEDSARNVGYGTTFKDTADGVFDQFEITLDAADKDRFDVDLRGTGDKVEKYAVASGQEFSKNSDGCLAQADVEVYGSVRDAMSIELFVNDVTSQASGYRDGVNGELGKLMPAYQQCMKTAGYKVEGLRAAELAASKFGKYRDIGQAPSTQEQDLAVTDYRCQTKAKIASTLEALFIEKSSGWLTKNKDRILGLRETLDKSLERSQKLIDEH